ncbi:hypothetical protein ACFL6T_04510 [Candidatus Zixiibacteriota bacterium]
MKQDRWEEKKPGFKDVWLKWLAIIMIVAAAFVIVSIVSRSLGEDTLAEIYLGTSLLIAVIGVLFRKKIADWMGERVGDQIFVPSHMKTAKAHSEGESLVYQKKYEDAVDWYSETAESDPKDWKARSRLVEILVEHIDDRERVATERSLLLRMDGTPKGLWIQTAIDLGEDWVILGRPDRALNTYKSLLWEFSDGYDADEVRRRMKELGA